MQSVLGKYIVADSFLHRLDPRMKIFLDILLIVLVFLINKFVSFAILLCVIIPLFIQSKNRPQRLLRMLQPVCFLGVFLMLINFFVVKNSDSNPITPIYWSWKWFIISYKAIIMSLKIMIRVYLMILVTSLLTATTKPLDLTRGLEDLLTPLKLIRFPTHIIAMVISIALRFIPTLLDESVRIMRAQASRGVDFKHGGLRTKVKSTVVLVIPLFVSSFVKAEDLANAMETRNYDPYAKRTRYRRYALRFRDLVAFIFVVGLLTTLVLMNNDVINLPSWWL